MQQENYNYRQVFLAVFFCALFAVGGLFFAALPASASHFNITLTATAGVIDQGESISFIATATCASAPCEEILFSVSGAGSISADFSTLNCGPTCSTFVTINPGATPYGFYTVNIVGTGADHSASAPYILTIGYNIKGWAWSDGIGWISFNSENCDIDQDGVMDRVNVGLGLGDASAPNQCPLNGTTIPQYGTHLDLGTLVFSEFAWSEHIGWITFNKSVAGTPPGLPYNGAETYMAKYNAENGMIEGWARAISCSDAECGADWGWIKMSKPIPSPAPNYGAHYTDAGGNRDFDGFAWGDLTMSWISFNSTNCDTDSDWSLDACGSIDAPAYSYRVWVNGALPNGIPEASNLKISFDDRCAAPFGPKFTFDYLDPVEESPLVQYVIYVYEQGVVLPVDTILVPVQFDGGGNVVSIASSGSSTSYFFAGSNLSYDKTYYFTVTVQDEAHLNVSISSLPVSIPSGVFKTDPHRRPQFVNSPEISWFPPAPFASSTITFSASSTVYVGGADLTAQVPATSGNSIYLWEIATSTIPTFNSTLLSPQVFYPSSGNFDILVTVTDTSGNACYNSDSSVSESCFCEAKSLTSSGGGVKVSKPKPYFREVKP